LGEWQRHTSHMVADQVRQWVRSEDRVPPTKLSLPKVNIRSWSQVTYVRSLQERRCVWEC